MTSKKKIGAKKKKSTWKASSLVPTLAVTLWNLVQVQRDRRPSPLYVPTPNIVLGGMGEAMGRGLNFVFHTSLKRLVCTYFLCR